MGAEGRQIAESSLSEEQWSLSQQNEAGFWQSQKVIDNLEQRQRNHYYRGILEDDCTIAREFFAQDFTASTIMDVGSGPEGILHVLEAKYKLAIDPLMMTYIEQGYDVGTDCVWWLASAAEDFYPYTISGNPVIFDYATCLNALDHMRDPAKAIENIAKYLKLGAEFLLITDLRTPEQLDAYHRLAVSQGDVLSWLNPYFEILQKQNYPHQADNPVRQLIVRCKKFS